MRTISGFFYACMSIAFIGFAFLGALSSVADTVQSSTHYCPKRYTTKSNTRATARYAPWKICIDEATIVRFVTNGGLLLAADLLGDVAVGDAWNSYDDEGPSFKILFKFMAGCAGMSVLLDHLLSGCPECPHCVQQDFSAQDGLETITPLHKAACFLYNLGKLVSVIRLGQAIYYVFREDKDFETKCIVTPAALIGIGTLLKDLRASYQEYKNYSIKAEHAKSSGRYSKCMVS